MLTYSLRPEADSVPRSPDRGGGNAAAGARRRGPGAGLALALPDGLRVPARPLPRRWASASGSFCTPEAASPPSTVPALASYREGGLDYLFLIAALATVAGYAGYSAAPSTVAHYGRSLGWTVPFVILGIARYVRLVYRRGGGGNPTRPPDRRSVAAPDRRSAGSRRRDGSSMGGESRSRRRADPGAEGAERPSRRRASSPTTRRS